MQDYNANGHGHMGARRGRLLIACLLCICVLHMCMPAGLATDDAPAAALSPAHIALPGFATHMPIVVLEASGTEEDRDDFFIEGSITTYDEGGDQNTLGAVPTASRQASIRNITDKTNTSTEKCDYYLQLDGRHSLLGLRETDEYILLGSKNDKSLIRNYLGYQIAAGIIDGAPGFRLCEVFLRSAQGDLYQGVYLLVEKHTRDASALFYHGMEDDGIAIDTYSSINEVAPGRMYIPFMESPQWDDRYSVMIGSISTAESVLFSPNSATFYTYVDLFDVNSFIGRFILGELMEDYQGLTEGYYYYNTDTKLFSAAPIWDFDLALDNQTKPNTDISEIRYDTAVYYEQFFKSPQFASQIQRTYLTLRRDSLNEKALMRMVEDAASYVAPAAERDWNRWNAYRHHPLAPITEIELADGTTQDVVTFSRRVATYEDEILRLKYQLRGHSLNMAFQLTGFDFSEKEISKEIVLNANPVWLVLFLLVFFSLIRFARRYGV